MSTGSGTARKFTILLVCSGNICRSPLAAQLLAARLGDVADQFEIRSAGTVAMYGDRMDADAAAQSRRLGGDPSGHVATPLTSRVLDGVDLVLTAERSHRAAVVAMLPRASRTAFTILQFARILSGLEAADLPAAGGAAALVETVSRLRGTVPPPEDPDGDDIDDPYRRGADVHERVADVIAAGIDVIATGLRASAAQGVISP